MIDLNRRRPSGSSVSLLLLRCYCCNQPHLTGADAPAVAADPYTAVAAVVAIVANVADPEL